MAVELDVRAVEEIEAGLVEAALWGRRMLVICEGDWVWGLTLWDREE